MNLTVPYLSKGDKITIIAPAKAIEREKVLYAKDFLEKYGFVVEISKNCLGQYNYFSGTPAERLNDFQLALDDPETKAILCARGGYGCIELVDNIQWASMIRNPKWVVGYSDITVFLSRLTQLGVNCIHGTVPLNFEDNSKEALETLIQALCGNPYTINSEINPYNKLGSASGKLTGGNLSILYSLIGTDDMVDYSNTILFIEDLSEHLYAIDRMFHSLRKSGVLSKINGLIVGGMTDLKDTEQPFGKSVEEIILSHFEYRKIPIAFNFPAGHISDNRALILGKSITLDVTESGAKIVF